MFLRFSGVFERFERFPDLEVLSFSGFRRFFRCYCNFFLAFRRNLAEVSEFSRFLEVFPGFQDFLKISVRFTCLSAVFNLQFLGFLQMV